MKKLFFATALLILFTDHHHIDAMMPRVPRSNSCSILPSATHKVRSFMDKRASRTRVNLSLLDLFSNNTDGERSSSCPPRFTDQKELPSVLQNLLLQLCPVAGRKSFLPASITPISLSTIEEEDVCHDQAIEELTARLVMALHAKIEIEEEEPQPQNPSLLDLHGMALANNSNSAIFQLFYSLSSERETIQEVILDSNGFGLEFASDTSRLVKTARQLTCFVNLKHISLKKNELISLPVDMSVEFPESYFPTPVLNSLVCVCKILTKCKKLETIDLRENNLKEKHRQRILVIFREETGRDIKVLI